MDYIHSNGILHLDIKPQNILIDENLNIKIADFGSSWLFDQDDQICEVKGTSYFLAPEFLQGNARRYFSGMKYDVWSIGITIYAMVFNCLPYNVNSRGMSDITQAILEFELEFEDNSNGGPGGSLSPNARSKKRKISEGLKYFLYKMLDKNPEKRASIQQLKKDVWLNTKL